MTLRSSDLQSDSHLDSIHNSCDVFLGHTVVFYPHLQDKKLLLHVYPMKIARTTSKVNSGRGLILKGKKGKISKGNVFRPICASEVTSWYFNLL